MNENLMKLKAVVKETNQVVANLKTESQNIESDNQLLRAKKFAEIRDYLMDCHSIVSELNTVIRVPIDATVKYLRYETCTFIELDGRTNKGKHKPVSFFYAYVDGNGRHCYENTDGFDGNTEWKLKNDKQYFFGCWWNESDEKAFVDNWNQDDFEKRFAAEIEKEITEKANKANAEYEYVTHNTELLGGKI